MTYAEMLLEPLLRAFAAVIAVVALTRFNGLRSFAKMSSFDFALTVATGSVLASVIMSIDRNPVQGFASLAAVFIAQRAIAWARDRFAAVRALTDNEPLLLMDGPLVLRENLRAARVTEDDLRGKLREANVLRMEEVRAVVLETTGDISVLHGPADGPPLADDILAQVRGAPD